MSTADTALSISVKMAPGPEHRQEPVAPDKTTETVGRIDIANDRDAESSMVGAETTVDNQGSGTESAVVNVDTNPDSSLSAPACATFDSKQEEPATLSTLNEGELRALLDEAITYKCPKDREGKSSLFKELLQEAEADETEEGRRVVPNSRCLPGSNRRRHKRDSVSERLTHGGSLQNLAQPIASEFDSSFAYLTSGSSHTYGGSRRKNKKYTGPSVSARQREGGSLPSNVNASHSLASLANLDLIFDKKKGFYEERTVYDWTNKEKSKSLDKPSYTSVKKEEKEKDKKDTKKDISSVCETELEVREKRGSKGKHGTNEMLESDNPPPEYKSDYMVIDLGDAEAGPSSERNVGASVSGVQRPHSLDTEEDEGTEMKIIEPRRPQYISRTTFDIAQTAVDSTIDFSLREHNGKPDKSKISVNGTEVTGALSFQTFNSVKCGIGGTANSSSASQGKVVPSLCSMMSASLQSQNITMEGSRYTAHTASSGEKKSLDENGNAVQNYNGERKKPRRKHTQEQNVLIYKAENVKGHRHSEDIDSLINFIENKESKSKKGKPGNPVRVKASSGTKPRTREKDAKLEQLPSKLQKSNSLEEISKTKLEDLTTEKSASSSGASSLSSQHGTINVPLRRAKQRSTGDAAIDSRGDRRSWGTEEGQSIYCNDTGDDYASRRNSNKKINPEPEHETEFLVVTKKKKSKKQRSSSGSRAQNLSTAGSYLQNSRGFSNEYRTPLSPELRRKSASSMPPSDKSDSSDSDSVHSLPVTSNTSKHNLSKIATSSGGTPQASYADIARMATINMSQSSVLNMATIVPTMLNTSSWPSVPPKTPSEPDKIPQDYYPSLDELQHSDRKARQHNFTHSNHILNLSFEKPPSPTLSKMKSSTERKKEAQEEAINKNIQVIKYVQDIEKMQQNLSQQEQKHMSSTNCNQNTNEITNPISSNLNNTIINYNLVELDNNNPNYNNINNKEPMVNTRCNNPRARRGYVQNNQNMPNQASHEEHFKKTGFPSHDDTMKKAHNIENTTTNAETKTNPMTSNEDADIQKLKIPNNPKPMPEVQNIDSDAKSNKSDKSTKLTREQNVAVKVDTAKTGNPLPSVIMKDQQEDMENKKTKQNIADKEQSQKLSDSSQTSKQKSSARPAVILLDETSDTVKSNDLPTELTFGFEINEQLLLSEDSCVEETPTASPVFPVVPPLLTKPPSFNRYPPLFEKHRDKFAPSFMPAQPVPVMVQPMCMGYPARYPPPCLPPPTPPPGLMEKYQPKEDFSMLYVAPEEDVNVQTYNHDKIVSFVGLAWDAVMREMPVTASGRIQYYSGQ